MEDDDVESPITCGFFSRRANLYPKKSVEELQAAAELVKKIEQENSKIEEIERVVAPINKSRKKLKIAQPVPLIKDDGKEIIDDSITEVILSSSAKKRLKKLRDEHEKEFERIEAENRRILSSVNTNSDYSVETLKEVAEDFEKIIVLTVMYLSKTSRIKCYENDKFLDIFPKVAESFNLKVTDFLLCLKTKNITVDDTPKSLEITDQDVLECIPYKVEENSKTETGDSGNAFKIFFQSNDSKQKIDLLVHKVEKMKDIMKRYSEERDIPLEKLIFEFDGERLSGEETPAELDMESESCIDVTVSVPAPEVPPSEDTPADIDMESESCIDLTDSNPAPSVPSDDETVVVLDMGPQSCNDIIVLTTVPVPSATNKPNKPNKRGRRKRRRR